MQNPVKKGLSKRAQELLGQIKEGISAVKDSQTWKEWMEVQSRFINYSPFNSWLIFRQSPNSTRVAGFNRWKTLGRWVSKGAKGIQILAPLLVKIPKDKKEPEGEQIRVLRGFKPVTIFDISQTQGKDLPEVYRPLEGVAPEGLFERLKTLVESKGFSVKFGPMPSPATYGYVDSNHHIVLREGQSAAQNMAVLCHETAHGLLGHPGDAHRARDLMELEAETCSWIVCRNLGLQTDAKAFTYLASWTHDDKLGEKLASAAQTAVAMAQQILKALDVPGLEQMA